MWDLPLSSSDFYISDSSFSILRLSLSFSFLLLSSVPTYIRLEGFYDFFFLAFCFLFCFLSFTPSSIASSPAGAYCIKKRRTLSTGSSFWSIPSCLIEAIFCYSKLVKLPSWCSVALKDLALCRCFDYLRELPSVIRFYQMASFLLKTENRGASLIG